MRSTSKRIRTNAHARTAWLAIGAALALVACGGADESPAATGAGGSGLDTSTAGAGAVPAGGGGSGAGDVGAGGSGEGGGLNVSQLAVGTPTFNVVGFQLFSAPLGTLADEFIERKPTTESILPDHQFQLDIDLLTPGEQVSAPPYDDEIGAGLLTAGFTNKDHYQASEWTAPQGIYLAALVVPAEGAAQGRSHDFESGPIVPNSLFPLAVDVDLWKGGAVFDADFDFEYPATEELMPGTAYDGYSHMPLFFWRNTDMIAGEPDTYQFRMRIVDAQGNGWRVFIPLFVE